MFKNPVAVFDQVRAPILGIDTKNPGLGPITGMPYWNVDMSLQKDIRIAETVVFQFSTIFANFLNHNVLKDRFLYCIPRPPGVWNRPRPTTHAR